MKKGPYFKQVQVMLRALPIACQEQCFALKGGTAINFFLRDLPRLSVDIDLTYLPLEDRATSFKKMNAALSRIAESLKQIGLQAQKGQSKGAMNVAKLLVSNGESQIKIEPNELLRGTVFGTETHSLSVKAEDQFGLAANVTTVSSADIYGGKFCAAFDRQHPRDLFDLHILFQNEPITDDMRTAFVVYLACSDRPMSELLDPLLLDVKDVFENQFSGMAMVEVSLKELLAAREKGIREMVGGLTENQRKFLVSIKEATPDWSLIGVPGVEKLPGLQWKLINIKKMTKPKHAAAIEKLKRVLGI